MLDRIRGTAILAGVFFACLVSPTDALASNARAEVVLAIQRTEAKINNTRWNFNTLAERKKLQQELDLLHRLYDRIIAHEGDLNGFPCAGAVIDGSGPPTSTEMTDRIGLLGQSSQGNPGARGTATRGDRVSPLPFARIPGFRGFAFLRAITDVEVKLLAQIVFMEHRLETHRWHFNNQNEQEKLRNALAEAQSALRRLRNSRC